MAKRMCQTKSKRKSPRTAALKKSDNAKPMKPTAKERPQRKPSPIVTDDTPSPGSSMIDEFSQRFMKVDNDISFKKYTRYSRKDAFSSSPFISNSSGMYGSTPSSIDNSPKSIDFYEFDEGDDIRLRLDLSPIKSTNTPAARKTPGSSGSKRSRSESKTSSKLSSKKRKIQSSNKSQQKSSTKKTPKNQSEKETLSKPKSTNKTKKDKKDTGDSGVFFTPPSSSQDDFMSVPNNAPTSTPSADILSTKPVQKSTSNSKPGNRALKSSAGGLPDSPMLSPVQKLVVPADSVCGELVMSQCEVPFTPLVEAVYTPVLRVSQVDNIDADEPEEPYKPLDISKTYANRSFSALNRSSSGLNVSQSASSSGLGFFDLPVEKRKRKTAKKQRYSLGKYEAIASQMNQEFDDLDDFQLSMD